jgi:hypothetical protein
MEFDKKCGVDKIVQLIRKLITRGLLKGKGDLTIKIAYSIVKMTRIS